MSNYWTNSVTHTGLLMSKYPLQSLFSYMLLAMVLLTLQGCGGGGSSGASSSSTSATNNNPPQGNVAPVAKITRADAVAINSLASLDGSSSYDANNDTITYQWTLLSRPSGSQATLANSNTATPSFTTDIGGNYLVQLIVNDGQYDSTPVTATVVASTFNVTVSWPANSDSPAGYTILVGANSSAINTPVSVLIKGDSSWNTAAPSKVIGGYTILNAIPVGSTQACFAIKAYNGVSASDASSSSCITLP